MSDKRYPKIVTIVLTDADQEYSFTLPEDAKEYTLSSRGNNELKLAYAAGEIAAGRYITIPGKSAKTDEVNFRALNDISRTIYVSCPIANETLEIEYWT